MTRFLNPLNQRRWWVFKQHRLGYFSLWAFLLIFTLSLCADFLASEKPLLVTYQGKIYTPFLTTYPETTFGGELSVGPDWQDNYIYQRIHEADGMVIHAPIPYDFGTINFNRPAPAPPSAENWLGTDDQGRDVLARILYGLRLSILFGLMLTLGSTLLGVTVGALQGYFGGRVDLYGQRFMEVWSGLPVLYLLIILSGLVDTGFWSLLIILLLFSWMPLVDMVRAEFLKAKNYEYVLAARAMGLPHHRLILRHILPNALVATLTYLPFLLCGAITTLASLDFLGFGLPSGSPSLGELIAQGKHNLQAPWLGISAFLTTTLLLVLLVFIGEAARDALDPKIVTGGQS
ncbi:ABC transporter permease [Parendozoicomonas haliclonae]|uniref:Inner membrane ABC transporter permease protein YejE n=1 Tax=Parendozoicomonas haliclonae TaxID=1960125 RepID=A0A1X7APG4_9GAMM|nr:ABC transporter permease [Parendozoicomonas haliclonae]SMA49144.1 Inner membrane ABC transporter permease protein YejE [Parendozoicomonas haliclonae]